MKKILSIIGLSLVGMTAAAQDAATVKVSGMSATLDNGLIKIRIGTNGRVNYLKPSNGSVNLLSDNGIYFDYTATANAALNPDKLEVVRESDDLVEVLYSNTKGDILWQQGYILRKGVKGVYTYVIANGTPTSSSVSVREARVCTRLSASFLDGYVDEQMQGPIPSNSEMAEAESNHQIQDATYEMPDGTIYTKYNWAQFIASDHFHGLMNTRHGVWNIPVSYEWLNGGRMRQELTVHATSKSPITIQMLQGEHLGGAAQSYDDGERQIFGPMLIYVNSGDSREEMIEDARRTAAEQQAQWPYQWFDNELYPIERGTVRGTVKVSGHSQPDSVQVVLAQPGEEIIRQGKKYIFWAQTDTDGNFEIKHVRPGDYALYAYALAGDITDEMEYAGVTVGTDTLDLGQIEWKPASYGNPVWVMGSNNRRADTWNISHHPRAYGLWKDVPSALTFTPGVSDEAVDFYYAQCHNGTWTIEYDLPEVPESGLRLTASVAAATNKPKVTVKSNGKTAATWSFSYNDAAIYRSATQAGRHCVMTADIPATSLNPGRNKLELAMSGIGSNGGVMYDVLKLEGDVKSGISIVESEGPAGSYDVFTLQGQHAGTFDTLTDMPLAPGIYLYRRGAYSGKFIVR
ncbi:MAG: hypothetical protein K2K05_03535 [Muribaculaceae bacterium]|nr:hypothetical protein [Muribaculaceae bacterium]